MCLYLCIYTHAMSALHTQHTHSCRMSGIVEIPYKEHMCLCDSDKPFVSRGPFLRPRLHWPEWSQRPARTAARSSRHAALLASRRTSPRRDVGETSRINDLSRNQIFATEIVDYGCFSINKQPGGTEPARLASPIGTANRAQTNGIGAPRRRSYHADITTFK